MWDDAPLFPEAATELAGQVDALYFFLCALSLFFSVLISGALLFMAIRYRRRPGVEATQVEGSLKLELLWTGIPLLISLFIFAWGAQLYVKITHVPADAMDIYVTGKQWMWKIQHPQGQREINELHVPVGETIRLTMNSEDVIHDFFVPAFRVKADVVPGMVVTSWFKADKVGEYHLFCAEYCGTKHSEMIGTVYVMEQADYQQWLSGVEAGLTPVEAGSRLFEELRCATCHNEDASSRGPSMLGAFGSEVPLEGGGSVIFNETYFRNSIMNPSAQVARGYQPVMPTFEGQISEEQMLQLLAYLKSLKTDGGER